MVKAAKKGAVSKQAVARKRLAMIRAFKKGGLKLARPWRYVAVVILNRTFYHDTTKVQRNDIVFWVNMDEAEYTLSFTTSPFDGNPLKIVVPSKDAGDTGNWGLSDWYRVRNDAALGQHSYNPTTGTWNGPPDPPDIDVGG